MACYSRAIGSQLGSKTSLTASLCSPPDQPSSCLPCKHFGRARANFGHTSVSVFQRNYLDGINSSSRLRSKRNGFGQLKVRSSYEESGDTSGSRVGISTSSTSSEGDTQSVAPVREKDELDLLVDGVSFGQLCDDFQCISSPSVEMTARQLARDIYELRESQRAISSYSTFIEYKDPLRSFKGREKFRRPSHILTTFEKPSVAVLQMVMRSTSILTIRWRVQGTPRLPPASLLGGKVSLTVLSTYELNQISGQVISQTDSWDLSGSDPLGAAFFWTSRLAWTVSELGKDAGEAVKGVENFMNQGKGNDMSNIYADPTDPRKFFQESNPNNDIYQLGFVIALIYLLVQFLKLTL